MKILGFADYLDIICDFVENTLNPTRISAKAKKK